VSARVGAVRFVDDTTEAINDFTNDSANLMMVVDKATKDAQRWNDLLVITGGALEIPKCKFHLTSYKFAASGAPVLDPLNDTINGSCPKINIQPSFGESESQSLEYLQPSTAPRIPLGCYKCPSGNSKTGLQAIRKNANEKSQIVLNSHLDARAMHTYYFAILLPSLSYSLPVSHFSSKSLNDMGKEIAAPFMNKLGYSRSTPHAV
jgi:hypothetical protein